MVGRWPCAELDTGLVLFLLGHPLIVSAWSLAVLSGTRLVSGGMRAFQGRASLRPDEPATNPAVYIASVVNGDESEG